MEIWICRHGETIQNNKKIYQGQSDLNWTKELSELGYVQAKLLAKKLSKIKFLKIFTSDLKRAVTTANIIYDSLENKCELIKNEILREKNGGVLEKKPLGLHKILSEKENIDPRIFRPKGGENNIDVFIRARNFMYQLITEEINPKFIEKINDFLEVKSNFIRQNSINRINEDINKNDNYVGDEIGSKVEIEMEKIEIILKKEKDLLIFNQPKNFSKKEYTIKEEIQDTTDKTIMDIEPFYNYNEENIDEYLNSLDLSYLNEKPYYGYDDKSQIKRILVISHSGFISELINVIRKLRNVNLISKNETNNTGITVIRIYCNICGMESNCQNTIECNQIKNRIIEFDFLLINNIQHLSILN